MYVNAFSSFFLLPLRLSFSLFFPPVRKLTQQSKRVVTFRVQSVYFVSKVLLLALQSVKKLLYDSLRSCSNAFLSVVRLPIQPASANKSARVYPRKLSCQFRIKFLFLCEHERFPAETTSSHITASRCLASRSVDSCAYCGISRLIICFTASTSSRE